MMKNKRWLFLILVAAPAFGQTVYKCPDESGVIKFQQMPCSPTGGGEVMQVKPLPTNGIETPGVRPGEKDMLKHAQHRADAESRRVRVGMTEEEAISAWGQPDEINHTSGMDQWIYRRGPVKSQYLYFMNGKLTGFN